MLLTTQIGAFFIWHDNSYHLQLSGCCYHHCPSRNNPSLFISCQLYIPKLKGVLYDELKKMQPENLVNNLDIVFSQILQSHEKELAEKDKEYGILLADRDKLEMYRHNQLKSDLYLGQIDELKKEIKELKSQQLFKEDFEFYCHCAKPDYDEYCKYYENEDKICHNIEHKEGWKWELKDNLKYDKLPSKGVK